MEAFPVAIGSALGFSIVTMFRIQLDWPQQESFNFLFNCLHWSFAMGAIFSLAVTTAAQSHFKPARAFFIANLLGIMSVVITFLVLYLFGGTELTGARYAVISSIATTRVSVAIFVSFIAFIILARYPKDSSGFASSFFMTHKAFFIALIYGIVIMMGASGVARAVQTLLYHAMSGKVFMYIGTLVGFVAFTIFIGYFPDFRIREIDEHRKIAQKKPRFIEILFIYILIPIVLALTAVLLIWAGKTVLGGMRVTFFQLSIIAASYTISGLWLHVMITGYEAGLANTYRRVYPVASLIILIFEAWAVLKQIEYSGLKLSEYIFILIWIVAAVGVVLLLILKSEAHQKIAILTCVLAVISILPTVGYHALPVTAQVSRLETILISQGILDGQQLIPAPFEPEQDVRIAITDAVVYLANAKDAKLPAWFNKDLGKSNVFKAKLGFEQTWSNVDPAYGDTSERYLGLYLSLPPEAIDISGYRWAVNPQEEYLKDQRYIAINSSKGTYHIDWTPSTDTGTPSLQILFDDRLIIDQTMNDYMDAIFEKYPPGKDRSYTVAPEDMTLHLQSPEVDVLLVFGHVEVSVDTTKDIINYGLDLDTLYMKENP